jgi:hypothetical protein
MVVDLRDDDDACTIFVLEQKQVKKRMATRNTDNNEVRMQTLEVCDGCCVCCFARCAAANVLEENEAM